MNRAFDTTPLQVAQWGVILVSGVAVYVMFEGIKWILRQRGLAKFQVF